MAEENFREAFSLFPACQKLLPHLYPKKQGFEGVFERRLYSLFTKRVSTEHLAPPISIKMAFWQPSKKHLSPIPIKMAFCTPYFEKYSPIVYRSPRLIATGNPTPHPLLKNISHLYEFLWGCWQPFLGGFNYRPHLIGQKDDKRQP